MKLAWVPLAAVFAIHDRQIARHGGASGVRDRALIEAASARPLNRAAYAQADLAELAAAHAFGLVKAHGFVDGNKRTGLVVALTFLRLNGFHFRPEPLDGLRMMEGLAAGTVSEAQFAAWLCAGMKPL